jgi:hypothetical protein
MQRASKKPQGLLNVHPHHTYLLKMRFIRRYLNRGRRTFFKGLQVKHRKPNMTLWRIMEASTQVIVIPYLPR